MNYGRGKGYAEIAARRAWRLWNLSDQEELFLLPDEEILMIPGVGRKTLEAIRKMQHQEKKPMNELSGFSEATYNDCSIEQMVNALRREPDMIDCKNWNITKQMWRDGIADALIAKIQYLKEWGKER